MKICVDARLSTGQAGGVEQFLIGLAWGLSQLHTADHFDFMAFRGEADWLRPYVSGGCRIVEVPPSKASKGLHARVRQSRLLRWIWQYAFHSTSYGIQVPRSHGWLEGQGYDAVHFALQTGGVLTAIPSIYNPHDLQHLHMPQYFTPRERRVREIMYRGLCRQARFVAVSSEWTKRDLMRQYDLPEEKVVVVELAAPVSAYKSAFTVAQFSEMRGKHSLPDAYVLYPAQTWPHKNHLGLLRALAWLRDREGIVAPCVCVGKQNGFYPTIKAEMDRLRLGNQVRFLGFVSPGDLEAMYGGARCVVVPTLFEAASFPLLEAFTLGVPVAASAITSLPDRARDAALLFSPHDIVQMAGAIKRLWLDEGLRNLLINRGLDESGRCTWVRSAESYLSLYERAAGSNGRQELVKQAPRS